jgi:leucyl aminopeptidase (aminopeptidase T)
MLALENLMIRRWKGELVLILLFGSQTASLRGVEPQAPDAAVLAKKLLVECARVKEGEIVELSGSPADIELLDALLVEATGLGADTLVLLVPSPDVVRRVLKEMPPKYDARVSPNALKRAEFVDVRIRIDSSDFHGITAGLDPARLATQMQAYFQGEMNFLRNNVRQVTLGNNLYPTEERARRLGLTRDELATLFHAGLNADYRQLQTTGEQVRHVLTSGHTIRITSPEGTDLSLGIAERPVAINDGVLSDDEIQKGGAACDVFLPAGETFVTPVPGTAEGTVVVDPMLWEDTELRGLRLTFKAGKLTGMSAESGLERFKELYDAAHPGKDELTSIGIGINPAVRLPNSSRAGLYMQAGAINIGIGNNEWIPGGQNNSSFQASFFLKAATASVGGTTLVEKGVLKLN